MTTTSPTPGMPVATRAAGPAPSPAVRIDAVLPRLAWTIAHARHLTRAAVTRTGITPDDRDAVEIAVSEACTNAVLHADPATDYQLSIRVDGPHCEVHVSDLGGGIHHPLPGPPTPTAIGSRGLALIRALTDALTVGTADPAGTTVHFTKIMRVGGGAAATDAGTPSRHPGTRQADAVTAPPPAQDPAPHDGAPR